jgi:hypothetical protein
MEYYLDEADKNVIIYYHKNEGISQRPQDVIDDTAVLFRELSEAYFELSEYQLLRCVLAEQTKTTEDGKRILSDKKNQTGKPPKPMRSRCHLPDVMEYVSTGDIV